MFHDYFLTYLSGRGALKEVYAEEVYGEINLYDADGAFDPTKYHNFPRFPLQTWTAILVAVVGGALLLLILLVSRQRSKKREPDPNEIQGLNGMYLAVVLDSYGVTMCMPYLGMLGLMMRLTALQMAWIGTVFAFCQTIGTVILGSLSDRVDKRWILTSTLGFCSVSIFLCGLAIKLPYGLDEHGNKVSTNWAYVCFLIARAIGGFFASTVSVIETLIAEQSTDENRTANIGQVMAYFGFGAVAGPIVGGFMYNFGFEVQCYSAAAVTMVNAVWACLTLDISKPVQNSKAAERQEQQEKDAKEGKEESPFYDGLETCVKHPIIFLLLFATAWATGSATLSGSVGGLFFLQVYQWGPLQIGILTLVGGFIGMNAQMTLPGLWSAKFGDALSIILGFAIGAVLGVINVIWISPVTPWAMILPGSIPPTMVNAQLQSLLTTFSPPQSLGTLFGFMQAMRSFGEGFAPPIGGWLLDYNLKLPFYVSSLLSLVCGVFFIPFVLKTRRKDAQVGM